MEVDRNVYFKDRRAALPGVGDLVLIYESETATVKGKAVKQAVLQYCDLERHSPRSRRVRGVELAAAERRLGRWIEFGMGLSVV